MTDSDSRSPLADFTPVPRSRWRERVEDGGRPVTSLEARTVEGLTIEPLYSQDDGEPGPRPPARAPGWRIALEYAHGEGSAVAAVLREDVRRGLEVAGLELHGDLRAGARAPVTVEGVVLRPSQLGRVLDALGPEVALHLNAGLAAPALGRALLEACGEPGPSHAVFADPLATLASAGGLGQPLPAVYAALAELTVEAAACRPSMRTILADAVPAHDAGASAEQEVALVIAAGLEHLRGLEAHGLSPAAAMPHLALRMAVGGDLLVEVAKLRAAARLWARVRAHAGAAQGPATPLWTRTSWRSGTRRDPWVNLLRGTVGGLAAVVGGAAVVAVQPFTEALGVPDADARRWAINTQHILRGESHLGLVDDPAGGSWTFEALTDALARGAWAQVQRWLGGGGLAAGLTTGAVQAELAERHAARSEALVTGRLVSTGTTLYPQLDEARPAAEPATALASGVEAEAQLTVHPLPRRRLTEPFEALRRRSDAVTDAAGTRPRAWLVPVGPAARARAQLDFARSFAAVGGFAAEVRAADAEVPAGSPLAILCGPAEALAEHGPAAARRLVGAGVRRVLVAGRPGEPAAVLREAGVHDFVHRGRDVLALLAALHAELFPPAAEAHA